MTDANRLKGLLSILIDNSIKFTYKGGISLTVESVQEGEILFSLKDTGIGMNPADVKIIEETIKNPLSD